MKYALLAIAAIVGLTIFSHTMGWFNQAANVAQEEFGPRAALEKYEWFKNQAAAIKTAELSRDQFKNSLTKLENDQLNTKDIVSMQLMEGRIVQARNDLAAFEANLKNLKEEYNAASAKFNWQMFKDNDVPTRY